MKRFKLCEEDFGLVIDDDKENTSYFLNEIKESQQLVDLLNEQHEQIEKFRKMILSYLIYEEDIQDSNIQENNYALTEDSNGEYHLFVQGCFHLGEIDATLIHRKDEKINSLQSKVLNLESIVASNNLRIDELQRKLKEGRK